MLQVSYSGNSAGANGFEHVACIAFDGRPSEIKFSQAMDVLLGTLRKKGVTHYVVMPTQDKEIYLLGRR